MLQPVSVTLSLPFLGAWLHLLCTFVWLIKHQRGPPNRLRSPCTSPCFMCPRQEQVHRETQTKPPANSLPSSSTGQGNTKPIKPARAPLPLWDSHWNPSIFSFCRQGNQWGIGRLDKDDRCISRAGAVAKAAGVEGDKLHYGNSGAHRPWLVCTGFSARCIMARTGQRVNLYENRK